MTEDPGPPPEHLVVRAEGEGFYARIWPRPALPAARIGASVLGIAAVAVGVAVVTGDEMALRVEVAGCVALFGVLLLGFSLGPSFAPVELTVDDHTVNWGGERIPIGTVTDCALRGRSLELLGAESVVLARIDGVDPDSGRWLSLAIRASLPGRSGRLLH